MSMKTASIDVLCTPGNPATERNTASQPNCVLAPGWAGRFALPAFAAASLILAGTGSAWAIATQTGPTLEVRGTSFPDSIDIEVGPAAGEVTLFGVDGVPDGETFVGVADLVVTTFSGDDSLNILVRSADVSIDVDTAGGSDSIGIEMVTPPGQASALFAFDTGLSSDTVEVKIDSRASQLDLGMAFTRRVSLIETVKIEVEQQVSGNVGIDLSGNQAFTFETFSLTAKGPAVFALNGEIRSRETKVEIDGDAAGNIQLTGEVFENTIEYLVKGFLEGSPSVVSNSAFSDSLKLFVEGGVIGTPLIDGRAAGFGDSCEASPGVLVINCDGPF